MRICPQCGATYLANTISCETCGAPLHTLCNNAEPPEPCPHPGSGPLRSVVLEIAGSGRTVEIQLTSEPVTLGRPDRDTGLPPTLDFTEDGALEKGVSRRHARLLIKGNQILIEDLSSANGTWVNDVKLSSNQPFPLQHGDLVRLGRLGLRVNLLAGTDT